MEPPSLARAVLYGATSEGATVGHSRPSTFEGVIESIKYIFYYKNSLPLRTPLSMALSVLLSVRTMRLIGLVITLLHPRDEFQDLWNGIRPQG
jgi:hypothetical protein